MSILTSVQGKLRSFQIILLNNQTHHLIDNRSHQHQTLHCICSSSSKSHLARKPWSWSELSEITWGWKIILCNGIQVHKPQSPGNKPQTLARPVYSMDIIDFPTASSAMTSVKGRCVIAIQMRITSRECGHGHSLLHWRCESNPNPKS